MNTRRWLAAWLLAGVPLVAIGAQQTLVEVQRQDVLGTSFRMWVRAQPEQAQAAATAALEEIARLDGVLSAWRDDSDLSRFNSAQASQSIPGELREVLVECERWRERTGGAFSCRVGGSRAKWRQAEAAQTVPDRAGLRQHARAQESADFDPSADPLSRPSGLLIDVDGLAKGYILDRALGRAREVAPDASGIAIDIGGDGVYWGEPGPGDPWQVAVADPARVADNLPVTEVLALRSRAVAASGHGSRGFRIGRRHFSHVLDPRSGWPLAFAPSAVVVAETGTQADALATALTVMPIRSGLALVESLDGVEALVTSESGVAFASSGWHAWLLTLDGQPGVSVAGGVRIEYQIPEVAAERYRRPYLAIWVSATDGRPLRQLLVLGDRARWLTELPAWWRHYARNDPPAVHGLARPTRAPGSYTLRWDGRDDRGRALPPGDYLLQVEAAREHGGHELLSLPFEFGPAMPRQEHSGRDEVGRLVLEHLPPDH